MALVDYSDSDESGAEEAPIMKPAPNTAKVQKLVDRSNPGKIRVSLPQAAPIDEANPDEPPSKRVKTGGGLFGGLASFLPPPKQTGVVGKGALGSNSSKGRGLGSGVSLKTGAAPGFSRESEQEHISYEASAEDEDRGESPSTGLQLPPPKRVDPSPKAEEVKLVGKPTRFLPLSVARKPAKKKKLPSSISNSTSITSKIPEQTQGRESPIQDADTKPQKPKVSLFSYHTEERVAPAMPTSGEYQPPIYEPQTQEPEIQENDPTTESNSIVPPHTSSAPSTQSLDSIASELNLSAAERRQLFGRQKHGSKNNSSFQVPNIINFNTDQEYAHNQELRVKGEEAVHNPVRAIAPGKHSLKQLVNAAQTQKDALEDSFAKGKSNRAEASSRYGW